MSSLQISLLGEFACYDAAGQRLKFPTRKVMALLAYLAVNAGRRYSRSKLAGLLWENMPESQARTNLRKALSRLQQALPMEARHCLISDSQDIGLKADAIMADVDAFERWRVDGTPQTLERALALYRGPFLEGLADCGETFEEWLVNQRLRLDEVLQQVMHRLLEHYVATGAIDAGIQLALRLLEIDPLNEGVQRILIRFYLYQDRIGAALDQYRCCRQRLADELGILPAPETEQLKAELTTLLPRGADERKPPSREKDDLPERAKVIGAAAATRARHRARTSGCPGLAVLAFLSDEETALDHHLGDGLAEDIATELGRFRELEVIAPTSALVYRGTPATLAQIGSELGADYLLEGHFRRRGKELRLTARLLEAASARQVWAERYDCRVGELFAVQDDMVCHIVGNLVGWIEDDRLAATRRKPPQDWQAYDLWLRGWSALRRPDLVAIQEARRYFQQALTKDSGFARAYVGLAFAHLNEWACFSWNHWAFLRQEALDLARRAVALDEHDHRAHCMLGLAELYSRRYDAANRELSLALTLNPNDANVLAHASFALALIGEPARGVEAARKALRLAPYRPEWHAGMTGIAFFSARYYQEAIDILASAPQAFCNTPAVIAAAHAHLGQPERAAGHRDTVYRHYRYQLARGSFPEHLSCLDWLLALDPYRQDTDRAHYLEGLQKAGFA